MTFSRSTIKYAFIAFLLMAANAFADDPQKTAVHLDIGRDRYAPAATRQTSAKIYKDTYVDVSPGVTTQVYLSNTESNRITCMNGLPVKDVIVSDEKPIKVDILGSNAFPKIQKLKIPGKTELQTVDNETFDMHVVCGDNEVYSLVGIPKSIPMQWIRCQTGRDAVQKNLNLFSGKDFEEKITEIMTCAYKEEFPDSFRVKRKHRDISLDAEKVLSACRKRCSAACSDPAGNCENTCRDLCGNTHLLKLRVYLNKAVTIDGEGFELKEYVITIREDAGQDAIRLDEKEFILPSITEKPLAMALENRNVYKGGRTRLFILEKKYQTRDPFFSLFNTGDHNER